jgi:hypothetical protein
LTSLRDTYRRFPVYRKPTDDGSTLMIHAGKHLHICCSKTKLHSEHLPLVVQGCAKECKVAQDE